MTLLSVLEHFGGQFTQANLYFIGSDIRLKQIQRPKQPTLVNLSNPDELEMALENIEINNVLGLVYYNSETETKIPELFFAMTTTGSDQNWLDIKQIENDYTRASSEIAMMYAIGYLYFAKKSEFQDFYPLS